MSRLGSLAALAQKHYRYTLPSMNARYSCCTLWSLSLHAYAVSQSENSIYTANDSRITVSVQTATPAQRWHKFHMPFAWLVHAMLACMRRFVGHLSVLQLVPRLVVVNPVLEIEMEHRTVLMATLASKCEQPRGCGPVASWQGQCMIREVGISSAKEWCLTH